MTRILLFVRGARRATALPLALALAGLAGGPALAQTLPPADPDLARNLAATCANCHGTDGHARGEMRSIAGMPAEQLISMLEGYRSGALPATVMHQIAKGYTPEQTRLIAGYFAAQQPRK